VKRGAFDVLRRGADNAVANWPLLLIRFGEMLLFGILSIVTVIIALVPILVSVGVELSKLTTAEDLENAGLALMGRWMLLVWLVVVFLLLTVIFLAVHAFVEAGSVRVYVDAERAAGPVVQGPRARYRVFSMERWMAGGKAGWWTIFWIYNLAWSAAAVILLIPLLPTMAGMLLFREQPPAAVVTGCIGLLVTGLLLIVVGAVTGMWVNRAINEWAVRRTGARESLSFAWTALRADLGRHVLVFIAVLVVAMAGSSFFASFSLFAAFGETFGHHHGIVNLATLPLRIVGSLLNAAFSGIVSAWYVAAYSALAAEPPPVA
jgi:hypothetical protein